MTQPTSLWLDCDTGHDDALAILLAARHPSLHLLGISTVYGNASLEHTTYNTRAILKAIGREDVPVYAGASKPFCREAEFAPYIHGESGLDGTTCLPTPTVPAKNDKTAVEAMYQALIAQPPNSAWLVATGAVTNIALLFALHPDLASHLAGVSIMGGAIGGGFSNAPMGKLHGSEEATERFGNHTSTAEFNICLDPESASSIFSNPLLRPKTILIPLDLTHQFLATPQILKTLSGPSLLRKLFTEILTFFAKTYAEVFGLTEGPPTHDPLAVAAIFAPELFHDNGGERYLVDVVTDGEAKDEKSQCGRTVVTLLGKGESGVRIPRSLEEKELWAMLADCLARADEQSEE